MKKLLLILLLSVGAASPIGDNMCEMSGVSQECSECYLKALASFPESDHQRKGEACTSCGDVCGGLDISDKGI